MNQQVMRRAKRLCKGLVISWEDHEPEIDNENIYNGKVAHKNPILRPTALSVWQKYGTWITQNTSFLWRITITVIFRYPNGMEQEEQAVCVHYARLEDIGHATQPTVGELVRAGENAVKIKFRVECLGDRAKRDDDFE